METPAEQPPIRERYATELTQIADAIDQRLAEASDVIGVGRQPNGELALVSGEVTAKQLLQRYDHLTEQQAVDDVAETNRHNLRVAQREIDSLRQFCAKRQSGDPEAPLAASGAEEIAVSYRAIATGDAFDDEDETPELRLSHMVLHGAAELGTVERYLCELNDGSTSEQLVITQIGGRLVAIEATYEPYGALIGALFDHVEAQGRLPELIGDLADEIAADSSGRPARPRRSYQPPEPEAFVQKIHALLTSPEPA